RAAPGRAVESDSGDAAHASLHHHAHLRRRLALGTIARSRLSRTERRTELEGDFTQTRVHLRTRTAEENASARRVQSLYEPARLGGIELEPRRQQPVHVPRTRFERRSHDSTQ